MEDTDVNVVTLDRAPLLFIIRVDREIARFLPVLIDFI